MVAPSVALLQQVVGAVPLPGLDTDLAGAGARIEVTPAGNRTGIVVTLGFPPGALAEGLAAGITDAVARSGAPAADVRVDWKAASHAVQSPLAPLPGVRNIIAVASGKGGVGKSTTAVNLALALAADGARVGLLDADVYGPSQPRLLGLAGQSPESRDGKTFEPLVGHGIETNSIGFLVDADRPVIWRGPMVTQALVQLALQTNWHDLDYLLVDLPPGTGDTQLTLTQKVPLAGVVIVTTPQEVALEVARRGLRMFAKVDVHVLGVVENMSTFVCPCCGKESPVFGTGGGERLAAAEGVPLLGQVPLDGGIRAEADAGRPTVVADPTGVMATRYRDIARRLALELARRPRDQRGRFGTIQVEKPA